MFTYYIYFALPQLIAAAVLCLPVMFQKEKKGSLIFIFLAAAFFYNFINIAGNQLQPQSLQYNWSGKILAVLFALAVIFLVKRKNKNCYFGITIKQKAGSVKPVLYFAAVYLIVEVLYFINFYGQSSFGFEGHLYQTILPGVSEEIVYRGLFLGLLNEIFPHKKNIFGAKLGYGALIVTLLFVLGHGLAFSIHNGVPHITLNWIPMIIPFYLGAVVVWMRERTGSVLIPILFHNLANESRLITQTFK